MSNATGYSGLAARLNGVNQVIEGSPSGNVNYIVLEFRPASTSEPIFQFDAGEDLTLNGASAITTNGLGTVTPTFQKGTIYEANKWVRVRYDFSSPVAITAFTAGLVGATYGEVDFSYIECDLFTLKIFEFNRLLFDSTNTTTTPFERDSTYVFNISGKEDGETHNGVDQFINYNTKKYWTFDIPGFNLSKSWSSVQSLAVGDYLEMAGLSLVGYIIVIGGVGSNRINVGGACQVNINGTVYTHSGSPNRPGYNTVRLERISSTQYELTLNGATDTINDSNTFEFQIVARTTPGLFYLGYYDYIDNNGTVGNYANKFDIFGGTSNNGIPFSNIPEDVNNLGFDIYGKALDQKITDGSNNQQYWQYVPAHDRISGGSTNYDIQKGQYIDYGKSFSESEFTLMFVISGDTLATAVNSILFDARDADNDGIRVWLNASGYPELQYNTQDLNKGSVVANGDQLWTVKADATDLYFRINGVQVATAAKTGGTIATTVNAILGAESFGTKTNFWTGLIAEFFPVASALTGSTLTDQENSLMTEYGII